MIHILDRQTERILDVLVNQSDRKIYWDTKMTEGLEDNVLIFEFRILADSPAAKHLIPKNKLTAQDQDGFHRLFIIDSVETTHDANGKILFVSALGDHIELANDEPIPPQTLPGQTAETAVQFVLANTRYRPGQIDFAGSRTITFDTYTNPLAALQKIASVFDLELRFRVTVNPDGSITRIVDLLKPDEVFDGKEIVFGKDMMGIRRKENTENICTRLIGVGPADEDGNLVTFASVNGGKIYVEDEEAFQRWNNAGRHIWGIFEYQPEDGTEVTPQQLLNATKKEMEKRKNSAVEWEVQAAALEQIPGLEHERVRVGMNVRIKDEAFDPPIYLEARVLETEMPELDDPNGNFSYTFGNYREVKVVVPAEVKAIQKIIFHNSGGWSAAKVKADIAQQIANEAKADVEAANARIDNLIAVDITALHAEIQNLEVIKANVEDLYATNARIDNLEATKANITDLDAINAQIENLWTEKANITDLEATNARIDDLVANDLTAINAEIENLRVGKADITDLNAVNARIDNLKVTSAMIEDAAITTAKIAIGAITTALIAEGAIGTMQIADASITDAKIVELSANKITAGTINTGQVTIEGPNGFLRILDNRIQVFDNSQPRIERVVMGDVNNDGSVYGFRVRGADGQTVLYDENGVYSEGITDGAITNPKIADGAVENRHITANTITGDKLVAGTITAREIKARSITANELATNTITAQSGVIADAAITTAKIADAAITNAKISSLDASKITSGYISADRIAAGSITAEKMLIGDFTNLCENPDFEGDAVGSSPKGYVQTSLARVADISGFQYGNGSNRALEIDARNGLNNDVYASNIFPVRPGQQFFVEAEGRYLNTAGTGYLRIGFRRYDEKKTPLSAWHVVVQWDGTKVTSFTRKSGTFTVPSGTGYLQIWISFSNNGETTNKAYIDNIRVHRMAAGELIVDGSITTEKLAAKSITADKLNVTSLDAISANLGTVTAGTIRGVNIYGGTIEGTVLKSSDTPSWGDPNFKNKASIESGRLQFWDKTIVSELKLTITGAGLTLEGDGTGFRLIPPEYVATATTVTSIHNGFIHVWDRNDGDTTFLIKADKFGVAGEHGLGTCFEVIAGPLYGDATVRIGDFTLKSEWDNPNLTLSGGKLKADIVGTLYAPVSNTYIANDGEARVVWGLGYNGGDFYYRPIRASSFPTGSLAEYKEDIHPWQESALEKIRQATIYEYYLKSELEQGVYRKRQGLVVGEGYNTPAGVIDGDGVEQYLMNAWSWKAIQELDSEQQSLKDRIAWLELENQYLKQKIQQLEAMVS